MHFNLKQFLFSKYIFILNVDTYYSTLFPDFNMSGSLQDNVDTSNDLHKTSDGKL